MGVALGAVAGVLGLAVAVLVRRERRRPAGGPEAAGIEARAARGLRDARRLAHARHRFAGVDGVGALRDRGSGR
ncbi:hypothetical protein [Streptomyces sp. NPDC127190]|uniref:hypothetical protein n=1 Tax=unclassified Streptomyces TaxID=2593676 RepID=UPI003643067E